MYSANGPLGAEGVGIDLALEHDLGAGGHRQTGQGRHQVLGLLAAHGAGDVEVARGEEALAGSGAALQVAPGGRVRLAGGGLGRVEEVRDDGRLVVIAGNIRLVVPSDAVAEVLPAPTPGAARPAPDRHTEPAAADVSLEADLRGMRVDEAEAAVLSAVDAAILADQPFLRIIHGKGTGADP